MSPRLGVGSAAIMIVALAAAQTRDKRVVPVDPNTRQKFERQVKVALLVGVGNYSPSTGLSALKYPARDVDAFGAELSSQGYLVRRLVDAEATRGVVRRTLNELATILESDQGTFIFYFSGHGFQQDGRNYLATFGSTADDLKSEGLALAEVESLLKQSRARQSMMFIDACRNDPAAGARAATGSRSFASLDAAQGMRVLYSTRSGRVSYESDELRQGVFTHFLVQGLRGAAAGSDGLVTFRDLADYVVEQTRGFGVNSGQVQVPYEAGESSGDFLLARASAKAASMTPMPVERTQKPGEVKVNPKDGQRYVWIPSGKFTMGCSPADDQCQDREKPAHEVTITNGFWLGQTPVTVGAWKRYAQVSGQKMPDEPKLMDRSLNPGWTADQQPITLVNWLEAKTFCEWSGGRLPAEAEWEYAARAGTTVAQYGSPDAIAWSADNSGKKRIDSTQIWDTDQRTFGKRLSDNGNGPQPVGLKEPNGWNLYDMLGNVYQWTGDWYDESYYSRGENRDPLGPPGGQYRVPRGGSWYNIPRGIRASFRYGVGPENRSNLIGFRCAADY